MPEPISEADVRHVAKLSRLKLDEQRVGHFTVQLGAILDYISKLNELDVDGVEPMAHPQDLTNVLRDDAEQAGIPIDTALGNAPDAARDGEGGFFKVPKVLGDGGSA